MGQWRRNYTVASAQGAPLYLPFCALPVTGSSRLPIFALLTSSKPPPHPHTLSGSFQITEINPSEDGQGYNSLDNGLRTTASRHCSIQSQREKCPELLKFLLSSSVLYPTPEKSTEGIRCSLDYLLPAWTKSKRLRYLGVKNWGTDQASDSATSLSPNFPIHVLRAYQALNTMQG